jgi:hypothetical protein
VKTSFTITLIISILLGISIAYIDTRPHWDDTGITVGLIGIASFISGFVARKKTWLIALSIGCWIPLFNIVTSHNYGSLIALAPAFIGAYCGYFARKIFVTAF